MEISVNNELTKQLIETYRKAPFEGRPSQSWIDEGKDAFQDGMCAALDILGVQIEGVNC